MHDGVDGGHQFDAGRALEHVARGAHAQGLGDVAWLFRHRQHDDAGGHLAPLHLGQHLEARASVQLQVQHQHVRRQPVDFRQRLGDVLAFADDRVAGALQQRAQPRANDGVVVDEIDSGHCPALPELADPFNGGRHWYFVMPLDLRPVDDFFESCASRCRCADRVHVGIAPAPQDTTLRRGPVQVNH